jgi:hypothetical protein
MTISPVFPKPGQTRVKLKDPGELLAATPHLLGFRPAESVLLVGHLPPRGNRIGLVLRGDLPPREFVRGQAESLVTAFAGSGHLGATIVVVGRRRAGPGDEPVRLGHEEFVEALTESLSRIGMRTLHALWVPEISTGAPWACYSDDGCEGVLPDVECSVLAAVSASIGLVTYDSREDMERLLDPTDDAAIARRSDLLNAVFDEFGPPDGSEKSIRRGCTVVRTALREVERGELDLADEQAVELAVALANPRVRDACLAMAVPPDRSAAKVAEMLWLALVRGLPAPERAEAASLLGYSAYMRGDGAMAGMAFDNALAAVPGHVLAGLLLAALRHGMDPERVSRLGKLDGVVDLAQFAEDASAGPRDAPG